MVRTEIRPSHWLNAFSWCQIIIWPKTIKGQPALTHVIRNYVIRNYVLLLLVPPLCLWWVTHIVTKALRLKILPGQQLPLFPPPPPPPPPTPPPPTLLTNQISCVESVSDENLLSSVQRWELLYPHRWSWMRHSIPSDCIAHIGPNFHAH